MHQILHCLDTSCAGTCLGKRYHMDCILCCQKFGESKEVRNNNFETDRKKIAGMDSPDYITVSDSALEIENQK